MNVTMKFENNKRKRIANAPNSRNQISKQTNSHGLGSQEEVQSEFKSP
jgi:hypothetical protein